MLKTETKKETKFNKNIHLNKFSKPRVAGMSKVKNDMRPSVKKTLKGEVVTFLRSGRFGRNWSEYDVFGIQG